MGSCSAFSAHFRSSLTCRGAYILCKGCSPPWCVVSFSLKRGACPVTGMSVQMGVIPTDTYPALVCDVEASKAVERLYQAKGMEPSKQLSILCKNFADIQTYTLGFPSTSSGQDTFRIARRVLPGPVSLYPQPASVTRHICSFWA